MSLSIRASALVFEDPLSRALLERIRLMAPSDISVLVVGETGTGKELVARHIHELSRRKTAPFLAVNCGALSETLVESELFGHEKGAFTGATSTKQGWFEAATGGTLFLDEIGDLPLPMQVKLLRVLQEREVVRVGSHASIPIDVRLIAATNVKLEEAVLAGRFREDLYYRLKVASLDLAPLRERPGDIMPLAEHFARFYGHRLGCPAHVFGEDARRVLHLHPWPGNIRELENVIHHALLVARNGKIRPTDLNLSSFPSRPAAPRQGSEFDALDRVLASLFELAEADLFAKIERAVLANAHAYTHNNQLATARLLGLSRHVVRARLLDHGLLPARRSVAPNPAQATESGPQPAPSPAYRAHRTVGDRSSHERIGADPAGDWWGF